MSIVTVADPDVAAVAAAARAVAHAMRPPHRALVERRHGDATTAIEKAMLEKWHTDLTVTFWKATGPQLTAALQHVTDADETDASFLVGAALHAIILGGQDRAPDMILRLAERAACWEDGRAWVVSRIT